MAKVKKNMLVQGISGSIGGELVFRQMPDGSTYISSKPNFSKRKFSKSQKAHQSRFQQAVAYARHAARTNPIYAKLAKGTVKSPYNFALSDWFTPPVIHEIQKKAGKIRVRASDNVMVARVRVTILSAEGKILERAEAVKVNDLWWEYSLTKKGKILAEVWDLAGNVAKAEEDT